MKQKEFVTADLYLTSAISIILNVPPVFRIEKGRVLSVFSISDALYKAMNDYIAGVAVSAIGFGVFGQRCSYTGEWTQR